MPEPLPMSPTQVAHATNTSRRTVMRAIEAKELHAFRDNRNHWKITPQAAEKWASAHSVPTEQKLTSTHSEYLSAHPLPTPDTKAELQAEQEARRRAEVEAGELRGKLAATEAERDRLLSLVERLTTPKIKQRKWWLF